MKKIILTLLTVAGLSPGMYAQKKDYLNGNSELIHP